MLRLMFLTRFLYTGPMFRVGQRFYTVPGYLRWLPRDMQYGLTMALHRKEK